MQFNDDVIGTMTSFHYTETNNNPENIALKNQLKKMFGQRPRPTSHRLRRGTALTSSSGPSRRSVRTPMA